MLQTQSTLGLKDQGVPLAGEDFFEAAFQEPYRYERVEGRLVVMSPSGLGHTQMVSAILKCLYLYEDRTPEVIALIAPEAWIRTSEHTDRIGDIAVYLAGSTGVAEHLSDMIPGLIFEVVSDGSEERDYVIKRREYFDLGVQEYAIVDHFRKVITAMTRGVRDYAGRELNTGDTYRSARLPGFELPVGDLPW